MKKTERDIEVVNIKTELKYIKSDPSQTNENYITLSEKMKKLEAQMSDLQKKENIWPPILSSETVSSKSRIHEGTPKTRQRSNHLATSVGIVSRLVRKFVSNPKYWSL